MAPTVPSTARQSPASKTKSLAATKTRTTSTSSDMAGKPASHDKDKSQDRINRKRVQNRISQQCVREKQLAHQKRLEALAEIIKASTDTDATPSESQNALLNNQMSLIEENQDLRDALLRMRKKMLSLSSAVAAVADDPIFEQILQKPRSKKKEKETQAKVGTAAVAVEGKSTAGPQAWDQSSIISEHITKPLNEVPSTDLDGMSRSGFHSLHENAKHSPASSSSTQSLHPSDEIRHGYETPANLHSDTFEYHMGDMVDHNMLIMDETLATPEPGPWNPYQIDSMSTRFVPEESNHELLRGFTVVGENSWKIEQAGIWYLSERLGIRDQNLPLGTHQNTRSNYNPLRAALSRMNVDHGMVSDISKMAVNLMCRTSGFTDYIYGVGANVPMEQVFQWRLSPSTHTRLAIMEPFRPTPLQYMTTDYPVAIDMVNWPTIRDQLILKLGSYDLDVVIADIVANTVIELPEIRAAINIHDMFFTRVFSKSAAAHNESAFGQAMRDSGFGEWDSNIPGQASIGFTSNDIFRFFTQRMQLLSDSRTMDSRLSADSWQDTTLEKRLTPAPKQPLATKWGLDNLRRWKLSREFADAYPFLDCAGVTASFPLYSSKMVPEL